MLEYILIHALVLVNWWATPQIREYAGKHYVTYPLFLYSLFYYGVAGILIAGIVIKNEERKLSFVAWYLVLFGDLALGIYRFVSTGTADALLILLVGLSGTIIIRRKLIKNNTSQMANRTNDLNGGVK